MNSINTAVEDENIALVLKFYDEVFAKRSLDICDELIIENYVNNSSFVDNGRENFKRYFEHYYKTFKKTGTKVEKVFHHNGQVCLYASHWASKGMFTLRFKAIDIYQIEGGQLVEHWDSVEPMTFLSKLIFTLKALLRL